MTVITPNVYYFGNDKEDISYTQILADYDKKKISCGLMKSNSKLKTYQKKWILQSSDRKRKFETTSDLIDFSLAQKFPNIICESILFDGLLFKKDEIIEKFSNFEIWPNTSPGIKTYLTSSIIDFSISDYFKEKDVKQFYFCESTSNNIYEEKFCSFIDKYTGKFDYRSFNVNKITQIMGNEKYKIFNLNIGIKNSNKILYKNGIKFVINNDLEKYNKIKPSIQFKNSIFNKYFVCNSNLYLYYPNNDKIIWKKNDKVILNNSDRILLEKYIEYGQEYICENENGESEKFSIEKKNFEIIGDSYININNYKISKYIEYESNLNLPEGKYFWTCQSSSNVNCEIIGLSNTKKIKVKILPNETFKHNFENEIIKINIKINDDIFQKNVIIYNYKNNNIYHENISKLISITSSDNESTYTCNIPNYIKNTYNYNIYWFIDEKEKIFYRNKDTIENIFNKNYVTCIVAGKFLDKEIIGAFSYLSELNNKNHPSWLKESYLVSLSEKKDKYFLSESLEFNSNNIYCYITSNDNIILTENLCFKNKNNNIYFKFGDEIKRLIKNYILKSQIIDIYNIPYFNLNIKILENNIVRNLKSNLKLFIPNKKPIIYASGIINENNNVQKCFIIVKDTQNLFLSVDFDLIKNKINKKIPYSKLSNYSAGNKYIDEILKENKLQYFEYLFKFKNSEDYCNITVSNGTSISMIKTPMLYNINYKKILLKNIKKYDKKSEKFNLDNLNFEKNNYLYLKNNVIIKFNKNISDLYSDKFYLKFNNKNGENYLDIYYPRLKNLKYNYQDSNQELQISDNYSSDFDNMFFSVRIFNENFENNNQYSCEVYNSNIKNIGEKKVIKYNIYLNNNLLLTKNSSKNRIIFQVPKIKSSDTIVCQVELNNNIESSSYTNLDINLKESYCYALDRSGSIVTFDCPDNIDFKYENETLKKNLINVLDTKFKNHNNILYARMIMWSKSQKNKLSISMDFNNKEIQNKGNIDE